MVKKKQTAAQAYKHVLHIAKMDLHEAEKAWDSYVTKIRQNSNQLNVRGVWQGDQLRDLQALLILVRERERVVFLLKQLQGKTSWGGKK